MAVHGLKNIALAVGLLVIGSVCHAQPVLPTATKLPTRPAPVSGKVGAEPAAVALHPASTKSTLTAPAVTNPALATSTARQVPPPANLNEPLLKSEVESAAVPHPTAVAPSAAQGKPHHVERTEGQKLPEATKGSPKASKVSGHVHVNKAGAGRVKQKSNQGNKTDNKTVKAKKLAQADAKQPHEGAAAKHSKTKKGHGTHTAHAAHEKAASPELAHEDKRHHHAAHHAKAASAPTVSTAHELKADAHTKHAAAKKGEHKVGAHHVKSASKATDKVSSKQASSKDTANAARKPAVKSKKKPAHAAATAQN